MTTKWKSLMKNNFSLRQNLVIIYMADITSQSLPFILVSKFVNNMALDQLS